jgi:hypothetical protein
MDIELRVYVGRPNPRWTLEAEQVGELTGRLARLSEPVAPAHPRLGYQGFVVHGDGPGGVLAPWASVAPGVVTVLVGPRAGVYRDLPRIEGWLLDQADRAGITDVVGEAMSERRRFAS